MRRLAGSLVLLLGLASAAAGQQTVRGQFVLPGGDIPRNPIRFWLASDDGMVNEYRFSDSNGRIILERLSTRIGYTITVQGDGVSFGATTYSFLPGQVHFIRVFLNPLPEKAKPKESTLSAASGYKPNPNAVELHEAALKQIEKQQLEEAEKSLRAACALDPKFFAPFNDLGVLLMQQRKYAEAEEVLRQALQADAKSIHALLNLAITLNHRGKYAEAIPLLREALRLEPNLTPAHAQLGVALVETEEFPEAEHELLRAVRSAGPDEILGQLYLGKLYARRGEFEKGIAALETYLAKAPNAANVAEVRALIERMKSELAKRR